MKKYVDGAGLKNVLQKLKGQLDKKQDVLPYYSNPNLLDNWYFLKPVNQRCVASFDSGYGIDRWYVYSATSTLEAGGIKVQSHEKVGELVQRISENAIAMIRGKTVTCSWLLTTGLYSQTYQIPVSGHFDLGECWVNGSWYFDMFSDVSGSIIHFRIINNTEDDSTVTAIAAKLELGDRQTLAHQDADGNWVLNDPPTDYVTELLKCQRYYHVFATEDKRPTKKEDFCPPMRIDPKLETIQIGGVDYYAADANL